MKIAATLSTDVSETEKVCVHGMPGTCKKEAARKKSRNY